MNTQRDPKNRPLWADWLCHLQPRALGADDFANTLRARLEAAWQADVRFVLSAGFDPELDSDLFPHLGGASTIPHLVQAFGIHPQALRPDKLSTQLQILEKRLVQSGQVIAVGEIGFDRRPRMPSLSDQTAAFLAQLELAHSHGLGVIIHCVQAPAALLQALRRWGKPVRGVVHGLCASVEIVEALLAHGFFFSLGPTALNPQAKRCQAVARALPRERLLLESDSPDQICPSLKACRNGTKDGGGRPEDVAVIAKGIAALRQETIEGLRQNQWQNTQALLASMNAGMGVPIDALGKL